MAVTKMKKVTIITDINLQQDVVRTIQGLQNVELRDVFSKSLSNDWVAEYFEGVVPQTDEAKINSQKERLKKIAESLTFITHHGDSQIKKYQLKRKKMTLLDLENQYDEENVAKELAELQQLKNQWEKAELARAALLEDEIYFSRWQRLDILPVNVTNNVKTIELGILASENWLEFNQAIQQVRYTVLELVEEDDKETAIVLMYLNESRQEVIDICRRFAVKIEEYPFDVLPNEKLLEIKAALVTNYAQQKRLIKEIGHKKAKIRKLQVAEEVILARLQRDKISKKMIQTDQLFILQGWVGHKDASVLQKALQEVIPNEDIYLTFEDPTDTEIIEEIPTKLENHPVVEPFEMLTEMYSLPKYDEIDPTPWFVPFFLVFFGMMVADLGYGLLMLVGTSMALSYLTLPRGTDRFMRFFQVLSIPTMIWGLIYNSFFGLQMPYKPLLSTTEDVITILLLSVIFGFIQMIVGLTLNAKENIRKKNYLAAVSEGFAWQGILIGIVIVLLAKTILDQSALFIVGMSLIVISATAILLAPMKASRSKTSGLAKGAYNLYGITSYIGDLVSYTRLMALGISGGSIAAAFNMLVDFMPPLAKYSIGILLIIALHGLNIFLSLLGAYVHGARLQYVEFFGKFYEGGGRAFSPLRTKEKYVNIEQLKNK